MIDRQHGAVIIECDSCGEAFDEVWLRAKLDEWSVRKIGEVWVHGCPDCGAPS